MTSVPSQEGRAKVASGEGNSISAMTRPSFSPRNSSTSHLRPPSAGTMWRNFSMRPLLQSLNSSRAS